MSPPHPIPPQSNRLVRWRLVLTLLGILFLFAPCIWCLNVFELPDPPAERRGPPANVDVAVRDAIQRLNLIPRFTPIAPMAESVSDGFHGEGFDWFVFTVSQSEMDAFLQHVASDAVLSRASTQPSSLPLHDRPPTWWSVGTATDLVQYPVDHLSWWVGYCRSTRTFFLRYARL